MSTVNKVILIGHLGDNVTLHHFENGGCVGKFPLATNNTYTNKATGEKVTNTDWHNILVKNKGAEICEKFLKKGDKVYVEGSIKNRKYTDADKIERFVTEIHVSDFTFLTPKTSENAG